MKRILVYTCMFIVSQIAVAQCKFSMTLSINGCSNSIGGRVAEKVAESQFNRYMEQAGIGFNSLQECNAFRNMIISQSYSYGNCRVRFNVSPCTGCLGSLSNEANIIAIGQGRSFFSTNSTNEIQNWSEDNMERMLALNPEYKYEEPSYVQTNDAQFNNALVIDTSKPFRSLNVGEDGQINTHSNDLNGADVDWQFIKATKKLPYESVEEYKDHRLEEAISFISKMRNLFNLSIDELVSNLSVIDMNLRITLQGCKDDYKNQSEMLEKILQLAEYKVEYKNIMMMDYMDKHPQNPDPHGAGWEKLGTWLAKVVPTPWMKEYQEKYGDWDKKYLEGREKELIETYGISKTDVEALKMNLDNDTFIADIASATSGLLEGAKYANQLMWIYDEKSKDFINGFLKKSKDVIPMVVVASDWIKTRDYESQRNLIKKEKEKLDKDYTDTKNNIEKQIEKTKALSYLVDIVSNYSSDGSTEMSKKDQLDLANKIGASLESLREFTEADNSIKRKEGSYIEYQ